MSPYFSNYLFWFLQFSFKCTLVDLAQSNLFNVGLWNNYCYYDMKLLCTTPIFTRFIYVVKFWSSFYILFRCLLSLNVREKLFCIYNFVKDTFYWNLPLENPFSFISSNEGCAFIRIVENKLPSFLEYLHWCLVRENWVFRCTVRHPLKFFMSSF